MNVRHIETIRGECQNQPRIEKGEIKKIHKFHKIFEEYRCISNDCGQEIRADLSAKISPETSFQTVLNTNVI